MFRNQLTALFTHERITTTLAKAKELRPLAEKMVTLAGTGTLAARRRVLTTVQDKDIARRLFDDIAPRFLDRPGGYTRIMRLGRRHGDGAEMAIIEFVDYDLADHEDGGTAGKGKGSLMDRAKGIFGGRGKDDAAVEADDAVEAAESDEVEEASEAVEDVAAQAAEEVETAAEEVVETADEAVAEVAEEASDAVATEAAEETEEKKDG
jgi:large subunit ribosomal protein L17